MLAFKLSVFLTDEIELAKFSIPTTAACSNIITSRNAPKDRAKQFSKLTIQVSVRQSVSVVAAGFNVIPFGTGNDIETIPYCYNNSGRPLLSSGLPERTFPMAEYNLFERNKDRPRTYQTLNLAILLWFLTAAKKCFR